MLQPWTLESGNSGVMGRPSYTKQLGLMLDFDLPQQHLETPKWAGRNVRVLGNHNMDLTAPGVRDLVGNPSMFSVNNYRTELFDNGRQNNAAPPLNDNWIDFHTNPAAQRLGEYWYGVCRQSKVPLSTPGFIERGQFIVPYTGMTAFRLLRPHSTAGIIH